MSPGPAGAIANSPGALQGATVMGTGAPMVPPMPAMPLPSPPMTPMPMQPMQGGWQNGPGPGQQVQQTYTPTPIGGQVMPTYQQAAGLQSNAGYPLAQHAPMQLAPPQAQPMAAPVAPGSSNRWIWWVVGLLALGAAAGAVLALVMR